MNSSPTPETIRSTALRVLAEIVPDVDPETIDPSRSFHEQLDIDSMDFLRFVTALGRAIGVTIPEEDYYKLATLDGCSRYFSASPPA